MNNKIVMGSIGAVIVIILASFTSVASSMIEDDIEFIVSTNSDYYVWMGNILYDGEPIEISLTLKNNGDSDKEIIFPTSQQNDYLILTRFYRPVYWFYHNKGAYQAQTNITIPAGGNYSWNFSWYQQGHAFFYTPYHLVPWGKYRIVGIIPSVNKTYIASKEIILIGHLHLIIELFSMFKFRK